MRIEQHKGQAKSPHRLVWEAYVCEVCGAGPGEACHGPYPRHATRHEPHAARARLASANHWANPDLEAR